LFFASIFCDLIFSSKVCRCSEQDWMLSWYVSKTNRNVRGWTITDYGKGTENEKGLFL